MDFVYVTQYFKGRKQDGLFTVLDENMVKKGSNPLFLHTKSVEKVDFVT